MHRLHRFCFGWNDITFWFTFFLNYLTAGTSPGESAFAGCVISYSVFGQKTSDFVRKMIFGDFASVP